jgi:hypothetical protein
LCFASPKEQVDPSRPANYAVDQSYGRVTSSVTDPDGTTTGGSPIGDVYNYNLKMGNPNKNPAVVTSVDPDGPRSKQPTRKDYSRAGANVRM